MVAGLPEEEWTRDWSGRLNEGGGGNPCRPPGLWYIVLSGLVSGLQEYLVHLRIKGLEVLMMTDRQQTRPDDAVTLPSIPLPLTAVKTVKADKLSIK